MSPTLSLAPPARAPLWERWAQEVLARAVVRPFRVESAFLLRGRTPAAFGLRAERMAVETEPGLTLKGWLVQPEEGEPARGTVALFHGISSCKETVLPLAQRFAALGFRGLLYDGRAHGESGGRWCSYGYFERRDFSRWLDALEEKFGGLDNFGPVAVWGTSLGGAVALQVMEHDARVRCGIVESTFASLREVAADYQRRLFGLANPALTAWVLAGAEKLAGFPADAVRPEETARRLQRPVLLIHGSADRNIDVAYGRRIFANLRAPGSRWLEVPGGSHHLLYAVGGAAYAGATREFLAEHCRA